MPAESPASVLEQLLREARTVHDGDRAGAWKGDQLAGLWGPAVVGGSGDEVKGLTARKAVGGGE